MVQTKSRQAFPGCAANGMSVDVGEVLVIAVQNADSQKLSRMLADAGFRTRQCEDWAAANDPASDKSPFEQVVATVLCHRSQLNDEQRIPASINRPAHLPDQLRCKRLIAVSDCAAEGTVIDLLEEGAHQCFYLHESPIVLKERLEAALRQHVRYSSRQLTQGDIRFDLEKRRVTRAGIPVDLSPKEFQLAYYLFSNHGRIIENSELMTSIWSLPPGMDSRRIDTAACRVRKKLRLSDAHGWQLKRLRSVGYCLENTADLCEFQAVRLPA